MNKPRREARPAPVKRGVIDQLNDLDPATLWLLILGALGIVGMLTALAEAIWGK